MEALCLELNGRVEAATNRYSATRQLYTIYLSVLVAKNQKKITSSCLVREFSFGDINHD